MDAKLTGSGAVEALARLRSAEARFRLDLSDWTKQAVVDAAAGLLAAGVSTPALDTLAGEDRAEWREVLRYLDQCLAELGMAPLDQVPAALLLLDEMAADLLAGRAEPETAAEAIWRAAYSQRPEGWADLPSEAQKFAADALAFADLGPTYGYDRGNLNAAADAYRSSRGRSA